MLAVVLALAIHTDPSNLIFVLLASVVWFFYKIPIRKSTIVAVLIIILSFAPIVVFDLTHDFANTKPLAKYFWLGLLAMLIIAYLVLQLPRLLGLPEIVINNPREPRIFYGEEKIIISGQVINASEIYINGERAEISGGAWQKEVVLSGGMNTIEVTAKKFLGGETKAIREIIYEKIEEVPVHSTSTDVVGEENQP